MSPAPVVVDTTRSRYARLAPVPLTAVTFDDGFWSPRLRANREVTLPSQFQLLEETGRLDNFRRAAGRKDVPFTGYFFNDSDVYKWLEAAAWTLAAGADPALAGMVETAIDLILAAQQPDGYLDTYFALERSGERWTNLRDLHELYCAGHFIQAAVAHHRATGDERLLAAARRLADHIAATFGPPDSGRRPGTPGHPEVEMALVELARDAGDARYRDHAQYFLDARGRGLIGGREYHVDHRPFRELDRLAGHAVRALYLCAGAADLCAETGEAALRAALERLWAHAAARQTYAGGGLGARHDGEAFGDDYELPNARAYAETCAAIASVMWNWRMLALDGEARYADALETALYNAVLAGLGLDGRSYFYENPLASDGSRRQPWFSCACCPPNLARLLASLPGYGYSVSAEGLWVHLYVGGAARVELADGRVVGLEQRTRYPWDGAIECGVHGQGEFSLALRVPGWCEHGAQLSVNGQPWDGAVVPGTYAEVRRAWRPGDVVRLDLPMPVRQVESHPYVAENAGRVALMRGPLLYCVEGTDHAGADLRALRLPAGDELTAEHRADLLGGVVVVRGTAEELPPGDGWAGRLYRTAGESPPEPARPVTLTAIPYYAWANRDPGAMRVWLGRTACAPTASAPT